MNLELINFRALFYVLPNAYALIAVVLLHYRVLYDGEKEKEAAEKLFSRTKSMVDAMGLTVILERPARYLRLLVLTCCSWSYFWRCWYLFVVFMSRNSCT